MADRLSFGRRSETSERGRGGRARRLPTILSLAPALCFEVLDFDM